MLNNMKAQLTDRKLRKANNFSLKSVMCTFFFEWVPMMSLCTQIRRHLRPWEAMVRWTKIIACSGGGKFSNPFNGDFFGWWERQNPCIKDYPYASIDFTNDPNVIIPAGDEPRDIGNLSFLCYLIFNF